MRTDVVANYFDTFNFEVEALFSKTPLDYDPNIKASKIHRRSKIRKLQFEEDASLKKPWETDSDDEFEETLEVPLGSEWSTKEKNIFFHCLSRYSIHRVEEWCALIPTKSLVEIACYYEVLKLNLRSLTDRSNRRYSHLLRIMDFPIAYEMSEQFIRVEEAMAMKVHNDKERSIYDPLEEQIDQQNEDSELIALDKWRLRWDKMYSRSNIDEIRPVCRVNLPISEEAYHYLKRCTVQHLQQLLWYTVIPNIDKRSLPVYRPKPEDYPVMTGKDDDDRADEVAPLVITKHHVFSAITLLKQTRRKEFKTLGESIVQTLNKYDIKHTSQGPNDKLFKNKNVALSLLPNIESDALSRSNTTTPSMMLSPYHAEAPCMLSEDQLEFPEAHLQQSRYAEVEAVALPNYKNLRAKAERDAVKLAKLGDWEADWMEERDMLHSAVYTRILLETWTGLATPRAADAKNTVPEPASKDVRMSRSPELQARAQLQLPSALVARFLRSNISEI